MAIKINNSAGGSITLDSTTTGNETLTLPSGAGTLLTTNGDGSALTGVGKVLQVVNINDDSLLTTSSTAWQTAMSLSITPTQSSSKILVFVNAVIGCGGATASAQSVWRGSTQILKGQVVSGATASSGPTAYGGSSDANNNDQIAIQGMDAPATTSTIIYYFKYRSPQGAVVRVNDLGSGSRNSTYSQTSQSSITLMEIGV